MTEKLTGTADPTTHAGKTGVGLLLDLQASEVAAKIGVTRTAVYSWRKGEKVPSHAARAKLELIFGIPQSSWSRPPARPPLPVPDTPAPLERPGLDIGGADIVAALEAAPAPGTMGDAQSLLRAIRAEYKKPSRSPAELARLFDTEAKTLALCARLEKEAELSEARLVRDSPWWARLKLTILDALKPHPAAAQDFAA